jgi:hypothetical protein
MRTVDQSDVQRQDTLGAAFWSDAGGGGNGLHSVGETLRQDIGCGNQDVANSFMDRAWELELDELWSMMVTSDTSLESYQL